MEWEVMIEQTSGLSPAALVFNVIAVIASVFCLAAFVLTDGAVAVGAGALALSFTAGMVALAVNAGLRRRRLHGPLDGDALEPASQAALA
jgi:hypothetical protein